MKNGVPAWLATIRREIVSSNAFLLYGNVHDYPTARRAALTDYLAAAFTGRRIFFLSRSRGLVPGNEAAREEITARANQPQVQDVLAALGLLDDVLRKTKSAVVIITEPQAIFPNGDWGTLSPADRIAITRAAAWGRDLGLAGAGHVFMIVAEVIEDVSPEIRRARYKPIRISLPNFAERLEFIEYIGSRENLTIADPAALARACNGLTRIAIDDILLAEGGLSEVEALKRSMFQAQFGGVLSFLDPIEAGFSAVAAPHATRFFMENIVKPIRDGRFEVVPMGVLLMGPPGTGKTHFIRCLATELGFAAVELKIGGSIASKWQGEGERNLSRAFEAIEFLAPVLVFIDEADQAVSRQSTGDNMQEARIFQMLMEFMSRPEHRGQVIFAAATNRPDLLDPAMKRPGRFDAKIPFLPPTPEVRKQILEIFAQKLALPPCPPAVVSSTHDWTGAELERLARKARQFQEHGADDPWSEAIRRLRHRQPDPVMLQAALAEIDDLDLLPPEWRNAEPETESNGEIVRRRSA